MGKYSEDQFTRILGSEHTPSHVLSKVYQKEKNGNAPLMFNVASHQNTPTHIVDEIAQRPDNPKPHVLSKFGAVDHYAGVALKNPNISAHVLQDKFDEARLDTRRHPQITHLPSIISNPNSTHTMRQHALDLNDANLNFRLIHNPSTDSEMHSKLLHSPKNWDMYTNHNDESDKLHSMVIKHMQHPDYSDSNAVHSSTPSYIYGRSIGDYRRDTISGLLHGTHLSDDNFKSLISHSATRDTTMRTYHRQGYTKFDHVLGTDTAAVRAKREARRAARPGYDFEEL